MNTMQLILTEKCQAFTGRLEKFTGYEIQRQNGRFYSKRTSRQEIPPDGHWRFIVKCAELAMLKLYFADIRISGKEISDALEEAGYRVPKSINRRHLYNVTEFKQFINTKQK